MRHRVFLYFILLFFFVSLIGGSVLSTYTQFVAEGPLEERTEVLIENGQSLRQIAHHLYAQGIIASPTVFEIGVRATGKGTRIKAGEYSIPRHASMKMVATLFINGETYVRRLVIPEGLTSKQVVASMEGMRGLIGTVSQIPKNGTLLPDTYHYSYGDTKEGMIERMKKAMEQTVQELWEKRDPSISLKTPKEAIVMASIVEKETAKDAERAHIASVFYNRMKKGIRLQSDPTVIFAATNGEVENKKTVSYKDLKTNHPYNTYVIYGLPVGPISNPGRASLEAVLHPDKTDDIYFVADGRGGHTFTKTYPEHQKNVKKWRQYVRGQKKIKKDSRTIQSSSKKN